MGILSDIGRSNAGTAGQTIFNDVMKYKASENQDAATILAAQHQAQTAETQRAQLAIQQAAEARAAEKYAQEQKQLDQFLPDTYFFGSPDKWSPAQKQMHSDLKGSGLLEDRAGVLGVTRRNVPVVKEYMNRNPEQVANWGALDIFQRSQEIGAIKDKIRAETDPEKVKVFQADLDAKTAALSELTDNHKQVIDLLPKVMEARAIASAKNNTKVVQSDESPTGWAYQNLETGDITEGAPAPRDYGTDTLYRSKTLEETIRHHKALEGKGTPGGPGWTPKATDRKALDAALTDFYGNMVMSETEKMAGMKLTPGQVYQKMTPTLRDHKQKVASKAWDIYANSGGAVAPSDAVAQAWDAVPFAGGSKPLASAASAPPAGFRDSGRTSGGKQVYISADGKSAWVSP